MSEYLLRPSAAAEWVNCHGSVAVSAPYPDDDGPEAIEGTAAHWAATELVRPTGPVYVKEGDVAPNGVKIDREMIEGAKLYLESVAARIPLANRYVETALPIPSIHAKNGGTPDTFGLSEDRRVLHVVDYKYGHGYVDEFENWQLIDYTSGILTLLVENGTFPSNYEDYLEVELTIVQPRNYDRAGPVRSWRVKAIDLRAMFNRLIGAADLAMRPNPPTRTGEWCRYCTGRHACVTLQRAASQIADVAGNATTFDLTGGQLGQELGWLQHAQTLLNARVSGLEAEAGARLKRGEAVAGYEMAPGQTRERWREGTESAVIAVGAVLGCDLSKPAAAITPAQARAKGIDDAVISAYSERPPGQLKLARMDTNKTRKIFGATPK